MQPLLQEPLLNGSSSPLAPSPPRKTKARAGINIAGAEFGCDFPGVYGLHYIYPSASTLDYYAGKNRTLLRLPFHWERIQHSFYAPLDREELGRLQEVLHVAHERGLEIILDVHNYGRFHFPNGEVHIIGSAEVPYGAFADLWQKLAQALKDEPAVWAYSLMNEPHDMEDESRWPIAAQAAIAAIREVDEQTTIMVAGDHWSSSRNWRIGTNEDLNEKVSDPQNNLIFESHCYFDLDNSGQYAKSYEEEKGTPDCGVGYVRPFVEWCQEKGVRGFVGEYGIPDTDVRWLVTMDRFLTYLNESGVSSAYWAGGPWWEDYSLAIEPVDARVMGEQGLDSVPDRPQMLIIRQYPG